MLIFAHSGITLGTGMLLSGLLDKREYPGNGGAGPGRFWRWTEWGYKSLARRVDIRFLILGALLPDIIDKPIGMLLLGDVFSSGRIFGHSLVMLILLTAGGLALRAWQGKTWLLALAIGTFSHLILDFMWRDYQVFLWPAYGLSFPKSGVTFADMLSSFLRYPYVGLLEILGLAVVVQFGLFLLRRKRLVAFLKNGVMV